MSEFNLKGNFIVIPVAMILSAVFTYFNAETEEEKYNTPKYIINALFVGFIAGAVLLINSGAGNDAVKKVSKILPQKRLSVSALKPESIFTGSANF